MRNIVVQTEETVIVTISIPLNFQTSERSLTFSLTSRVIKNPKGLLLFSLFVEELVVESSLERKPTIERKLRIP
jgi:hypothetical protein